MATTDLQTDLNTGELVITNGELNLVVGRAAVAQWLANRLRTWAGEWFLNLDYGVDYRGLFFVKPVNLDVVASHLKRVIATTDGVLAILEFSLLLDKPSRKLTMTATVLTIDGDLPFDAEVAFAEAAAFVVMFTPGAGIWPG